MLGHIEVMRFLVSVSRRSSLSPSLREMLQQSVEPDVISYNAAVSACEKSVQPEQALELLREMQAAECRAQCHQLQRLRSRLRPMSSPVQDDSPKRNFTRRS